MSRTRVSCIVPVRNGERYIDEALASIHDQTHDDIEVVVVDDGSSDATRKLVRRWGGAVEYIHVEYGNSTAARNRGLAACRGDYVAFLDADDRWRCDKLELQLRALARAQDPALCVTHVQNFYSPDAVAAAAPPSMLEPMPGFVAGTLLVHRRIFELVGPFDDSLLHGSALDWFLRARESGCREVVLAEVLLQRRLHDANISAQCASASRHEHLDVVRAALRRRRGPASGGAPETP